jgi:hypothetical protein
MTWCSAPRFGGVSTFSRHAVRIESALLRSSGLPGHRSRKASLEATTVRCPGRSVAARQMFWPEGTFGPDT